MFKTRKNYAAYYDKSRESIVAVPRVRSIPKYVVGLTFFFIGSLTAPLFLLWGVNHLVAQLARWDVSSLPGGYAFLSSFLAFVLSGFLLVEVGPRLGFFPGTFGGRLVLSKTHVDRKLARLVDKHPYELNVDWFPQWVEAKTLGEQEKIFADLKQALKKQ